MSLPRTVEPELLDALAPGDPRAVRSRQDLRRINRVMAAAPLLAAALDPLLDDAPRPVRLLDIGAGDGTLLLRLGRRHAARWPPLRVGLLDLQPAVRRSTLDGYRALGWDVEVIQADVLDWLTPHAARYSDRTAAAPGPVTATAPVVIANLFLHHFEGERLQALLRGIAMHARAFACLEPRRSRFSLLGSRLVGMIGGNDVTRHDAVASVHAGFAARELSGLWPGRGAWQLREDAVGLFSHRFIATRGTHAPTTRADR